MRSERAERLITELEKSGDSQQLAVGDCLRTISDNGGDQETDKFLAVCANEIIDAARYARAKLSGDAERRPDFATPEWRKWISDVASGRTELGLADWAYNKRHP